MPIRSCGLLVVLLVVTFTVTTSADDSSHEQKDPVIPSSHQAAWSQFKQRHSKAYSGAAEDEKRFSIWLNNQQLIDAHSKSPQSSSYTLSDNHLSDLTAEEYSRLRGFRSSHRGVSRTFPVAPTIIVPIQYQPYTNTVPISQLPASVNWTASGWVNPVQDQGSCGDCWSFSAAGSMEGQYYNATRTSAILSEQNLLDCSSNSKYGNDGCNGGSMDGAFQYVIDNKGINPFVTYPYTGQLSSTCQYNPSQSMGYITGFRMVKQYDEAALQQAVALVGPVSVGINAHLPSFQLYRGGVYNPGSSCSQDMLDHAVLAVGYGTTSDGQQYWLLKNSWGTDWGIQGYMMLARNSNNTCGIASDASFPTHFVSSGFTVKDQGTAPGGAAPVTTPTITNTLLLLVVTCVYLVIASQL